VTDLWQRQGLDVANALVVSESQIVAGAIDLAITGTTTKTVQRQ
jgi:hypothetical protein